MASQIISLSPRDIVLRDVAEEFEGRFVTALIAGDVDALVALFQPPLPVFFPGGVKVDVNSSDVYDGISFFVEGIRKFGVVRAEPKISHVRQRDATGAISYFVETRMFDRKGDCVRTALAWRFLEMGKDGYRITMQDVQQPAIGVSNGNRKLKFIN